MKVSSCLVMDHLLYESPSVVIVFMEAEGVLCDSTAPGGTEMLEEGNDWDFGW